MLAKLNVLLWSFIFLAMSGCPTQTENASENTTELFSYNGKKYTNKDLPEEMQVSLHDAKERYNREIEIVAEQYVFNEYLKKLAAKEGKPIKEVEKSLLEPKEPSEQEIKAFYEEKKAKIPYPYATVKAEIKRVMTNDRRIAARRSIMEKIQAETGYEMLLKTENSPVVHVKTEGFASKGSSDAKITVVEFADFKCPHCLEAYNDWKIVFPQLKDKIQLVFMYFPLNDDVNSLNYALAKGGYCAHKQNKFWEYHDFAYENQNTTTDKSPDAFAKKFGLDESAFASCMRDKATENAITQSKDEGIRIGVKATPTFFVNGEKVYSDRGLKNVQKAVSEAG